MVLLMVQLPQPLQLQMLLLLLLLLKAPIRVPLVRVCSCLAQLQSEQQQRSLVLAVRVLERNQVLEARCLVAVLKMLVSLVLQTEAMVGVFRWVLPSRALVCRPRRRSCRVSGMTLFFRMIWYGGRWKFSWGSGARRVALSRRRHPGLVVSVSLKMWFVVCNAVCKGATKLWVVNCFGFYGLSCGVLKYRCCGRRSWLGSFAAY